ncbi:type III secretion regulator YopN/LcrE/InvE/MxiC [Cedecea neteri]|uniref:Type III secretion regulator YopN/LcrE/InvE/MxiC n=1 Tax=Cedecea neteri TaxID=158822 RepID=A0A2X2V4C2_9ENTR|nr:type III secretion regulator YopN/LcrE/InvE/MxiC [Cedecea neteri]
MRLRNGSNPALAARVEQMLADLQQQHPEKINAGVNTAPAIAAFSSDPAQKREMRKLYYSGVINQQSADNIMDVLLDKFGVDGFVPALRTLQRALSDDIAALAPSAPPTALRPPALRAERYPCDYAHAVGSRPVPRPPEEQIFPRHYGGPMS